MARSTSETGSGISSSFMCIAVELPRPGLVRAIIPYGRGPADDGTPTRSADTESVSITRDDVLAAARRTEGRVRRTPLLPPARQDAVWLKCEFLQHCGVFKTRGAFNRQLAASESGELSDAGIVVA